MKAGLILATLALPSMTYSQPADCPMKPPAVVIVLPDSGFSPLNSDEGKECDQIPRSGWKRQPGEAFDLVIHAEGPSGSGRYWHVILGVARPGEEIPYRGVCFETSTIGWRTLQKFGDNPLPWVGDQNHDGVPELIVWSSFPLDETAFGLVGWIFRLDGEKYRLDVDLSRSLAQRLSDAYREPRDVQGGSLALLRDKAHHALEAFAQGRCVLRMQ